ncbi:hypothetical protein WJX73_008595 [Symbiochloris irregularis]|uniref:F-box domain-containing protein n=1 Tax=Symbiochloris irregularis TaxID=706552 RepID=A0AAW1P329_9CHLO
MLGLEQNASGFRRRPELKHLPSELVTNIFTRLTFEDKLQAQLCCRSWARLLRVPQAADVWGSVEIHLTDLPSRLAPNRLAILAKSHTLFQPVCRWLQQRCHGITCLTLLTDNALLSC